MNTAEELLRKHGETVQLSTILAAASLLVDMTQVSGVPKEYYPGLLEGSRMLTEMHSQLLKKTQEKGL